MRKRRTISLSGLLVALFLAAGCRELAPRAGRPVEQPRPTAAFTPTPAPSTEAPQHDGTAAAKPLPASPTPRPTPMLRPPSRRPVASVVLAGHTAGVTNLAWAPDGQLLASSAGALPGIGPQDSTVRLWKPDGALATTLQTGPVLSLAWSPDSATLATGSSEGKIRLWRRDGRSLATLDVDAGMVFALAWSPDGQTLASGSVANPKQNTVQLWRAYDRRLLKTLSTNQSGGKFYNLRWSPDSSLLAGGAIDYKIWRADGSEVFAIAFSSTPAWGMAWAPDGTQLAIGNENGEVTIYTAQGKESARLQNTDGVNSIAWSPDGSVLAAGNHLWRRDQTRLAVLSQRVKDLSWSPDGTILATVPINLGALALWSAGGKLLDSLAGHTAPINKVAWAPDGALLASASEDRTVRLWKMRQQ